ncbi:MAG: hypothetical protein ACC619_09255 [Paracoccaceae bacterium]
MTALKEFERLESPGIWRANPEAQRRDVIVALGDATLTISDAAGRALAHWSLPAVERINPAERPAMLRPGPDATETLELSDDTMIVAIKKVQNAIRRRRPHPGRLRLYLLGGGIVLGAALALFWLPGAMIAYTVSVVPDATRTSIGESLLANIRRVSGKPCDTSRGQRALQQLYGRMFPAGDGKIVVLTGGVRQAEHLPGHIIILNRALVEDYETPAVAAGFVLAEDLRAGQNDPLLRLLNDVGLVPSFRLLTSGNIPAKALASYAETLLSAPPVPLDDETLLARFRSAEIRSTPYAYAIDISGETTLGLIEADPMSDASQRAVLSDRDWASLQAICGE